MKRARPRVLIALTSILVAAHAGYAGPVKFGVQGGLSIPNIRGGETNIFSRGFTSRQGPFFGLAADVGVSPRFSLGVELNYTSQGGLRKGLQPITMELPPGLPLPPGTLLFADFRNETILDYLELPVLARLSFGGKARFFVNAGPYAGILVRGRAVTSGQSALYLDEAGAQPIIIPPATDPMTVDLGADTDVKASVKKANFGVAGGGGVIYPLGRVDLILQARFQLGLTAIQKDVETNGDSQTGAFLISVGFLIPLAKR
jgi:Outer membrane protein beta-barrel domain